MSGFMFCTGPCINCGTVISFNPSYVPSVRYPAPDGPKEPLCRRCATEFNRIIVRRGDRPVPIHPDAYDPEPCP